jgi:hypothetical protein
MASSVDSDCATDKESQRSVLGNLHAVGGMIANWLCNSQSNVTLSTREAQHLSMSKGLQEVLFSQMLIREVGGVFKTAIVLEDNAGATFLVKNQQVGAQAAHIDACHHFIQEHCEAKNFDIKRVKSEENELDILTKNATEREAFGRTCQKHPERNRDGLDGLLEDC